MSDDTIENKNKPWYERIKVSETLAIALIPIISEIILVIFEYGYFSIYHIPYVLVSFDWGNLFIVSVSILMLGVFGYYYIDSFLSAIKSTKEPIREKLLRSFGAFILFFIFSFIYGPKHWKEWLPAVIGVTLILINEFLFPLFIKGKHSYTEKLKLHAENRANREKNMTNKSFLDKIFQFLGPKVLLFLFFLYVVYNFGRASAMNQETFYTLNTSPETVVLWMENEKFIIAPFNNESKTYGPGFQVVNIGDDVNILYTKKNIGQLTFNNTAIVGTQSSSEHSSTPIVSMTPYLTLTPILTQTIFPIRTLTPTPKNQITPLIKPTISPTQ